MEKKDWRAHYSPSQINMFTRCGEQYRRRYVENERLAPGVAALRGTAVHEGARLNFTQKLDTRADLPASEIVDAAAEKFRAEASGEVAFTEEERAQGIKATIGQALDETVRYAQAHAEQQAPDYQPVLIEERVEIATGIPGRSLMGVLDLADEHDDIVDLKTKGRTPPQSDVDTSLQLTTYHALFRAKMKRPPRRILHDVLVGLKGGVKRVVLETQRTDADFAALAARIVTIDAAIKAGNFIPAAPDSWACSRNWCGFYQTCKYVNGAR
jgi:hypothetical protein